MRAKDHAGVLAKAALIFFDQCNDETATLHERASLAVASHVFEVLAQLYREEAERNPE